MIKHSTLVHAYFVLVTICGLLSFRYVYHINNTIHAQPTISLVKHHHKKRDRDYRIYSHHYLAVEHRDLNSLYVLGNHYARLTNSVYENDFNGTHPIYHKFHDHNYWIIFSVQPVPSNIKSLHMSNRTYNIIQHRVLRSHGVYHGVNFGHNKIHRMSLSFQRK